jgi:hypothetical protein
VTGSQACRRSEPSARPVDQTSHRGSLPDFHQRHGWVCTIAVTSGQMAIHPQMEAVRRIHHASPSSRLRSSSNQHDIGLVEAESEAEHPVCAWPIAARGDLTGERGLVAASRLISGTKSRRPATSAPRRRESLAWSILSTGRRRCASTRPIGCTPLALRAPTRPALRQPGHFAILMILEFPYCSRLL